MIVWRPNAAEEFAEAIQYIMLRNEDAADRFREDVGRMAELLVRRPGIGRPSRYAGLRAWSMPQWHKIIIFRELGAGIEIAALLDARQQAPGAIL